MIRRLPVVAALAAAWTAGAWFLWQSKVPSSLRLPHVDPHRFFTAAQLHAASSYSNVDEWLWAGGVVVQIVILALYAWRGERFARESAAGPIGTGMLLGMVGFALVWAAQVPFSVLGLWWERRHHLTSEGYFSTVFGGWLGLGGEFVFLCASLAVIMGFAQLVGERWWLPAAPVFVGLALLFAFIAPWLVPTNPLHDARLRAAAVRFERAEGVAPTPVVVAPVHRTTTLPNAEAAGIGPSRRVILFDTIVDGRFTERELEVVLAHELGHLARHHIWKDVGWYALFAFPGAWAIARATRRRGGMGRPAAVPLALLVLVVLNLLALPLQNAISRHMEAEADWMALRTTRDPAAAIALFRRFVPTTLEEPRPSTFDYLVLENHPTLVQRIGMAEAWSSYATSAAQSP
ncbi:MAG TPA: M48 family metalloprotease [Gaiellaceae bacterium]|nr:M48 family metalloprotease [Gaiellaceae bacterium]